MGEHKRPTKILTLNPGGNGIIPARPAVNADVMSVEDALRLDIEELQERHREAVAAIQIHHQALQQIVALVNSLEDRTVRGRIRRARAWLALQREVLRGYAIECGLIPPVMHDPNTPSQE